MSPRPKPWDILAEESGAAYTAFSRFLELPSGDRQLPAVASQVPSSLSMVEKWSSQHRWFSRARAYDAHREAVERRRKESRRGEVADQVFEAAVGALVRFRLWDTNEAASDPTMTASVQIQRARFAVDTILKLVGTPTKVEVSGPGGIPLGDAGAQVEAFLERLVDVLGEYPDALDAVLDEIAGRRE